MAINISIIYNHLLWADSLNALLRREDLFHLSHVLKVDHIASLNHRFKDIVLLEATYPNAELVNQVINLKKNKLQVIVIGYHLDNEFIDLLLVKGLDGFVLKTCGKANLYEAIKNVHQGKKYFCAPIAESLSKRLYNQSDKNTLTTREKEVLVGLVCFKSTSNIARQMHISDATVRTHRKNIMRKFGSKNYLGLLRYACREGLLQTPDEQFCVGCQNKRCTSPHFG
ncbi:response regulator transcription factor [Carboxylicivirga mesophila]|uniref:Response regulator transcription factor n=1 Tax=Carboxylicivirga mesophila TaxID=1166478 RepID=A0ABS5KH66_9BACT|nr:response regulator transcription factor [Carboxylicivirga mesophila]MBS2213796.1 response regulator transcription factor [Carboxylicivirga mesophila]